MEIENLDLFMLTIKTAKGDGKNYLSYQGSVYDIKERKFYSEQEVKQLKIKDSEIYIPFDLENIIGDGEW